MDFPNFDYLWLYFYENSKLTEYSNIPLSNEEVIQTSRNFAPSLPVQGQRYALTPRPSAEVDLYSAITNRTSQASQELRELSFEALSDLLFYTYGSKRESAEKSLLNKRNAPSAGGLYPLELFFFAQKIASIPDGLYYFDAHQNEAVLINPDLTFDEVNRGFVSADPISNKNLLFFFCPIFKKTLFKYHNRGFRFVFLEAGHIAQNLLLIATALQLKSIPIGGYFEYKLDELLKLDGYDMSCVYTLGIGH